VSDFNSPVRMRAVIFIFHFVARFIAIS